jgi:hypothetical protein
MHVEISNNDRLAFDRPKAKPFEALGKLSSTTAHWLPRTKIEKQILQETRG